jgi:hypothetical protein
VPRCVGHTAGSASGDACKCGGVRSAYRAAQRNRPHPPPGGRLNGNADGTGLAN